MKRDRENLVTAVTGESEAKATRVESAKVNYFDAQKGHGFTTKSTDGSNISIAETIGLDVTKEFAQQRTKGRQQDAIFAGYAESAEVAKDPTTFFEATTKDIVERNKDQYCGSTFCAALLTSDAKGSKTIHTANLGDSRISLVIRGSKASYSLSLTEDHDTNVARVVQNAIDNGGQIIATPPSKGRISHNGGRSNIGVCGAIGDSPFGNKLLRKADIWQHDLSQLITDIKGDKDLGDILDVHLVISCDGLFEGRVKTQEILRQTADNKLVRTKENDTHSTLPSLTLDNLVDEYLNSPSPLATNLSAFLAQKAIELGSTDNVSIATIPLVTSGQDVAIAIPIMAVVADGHGLASKLANGDLNLHGTLVRGANYNEEKHADGGVISARAAAHIYHAAQIKDPAGLEIDNKRAELKREIDNLRDPLSRTASQIILDNTQPEDTQLEETQPEEDFVPTQPQPKTSLPSGNRLSEKGLQR